MQEYVNNLQSDSALFVSLPINNEAQSDDYIIPWFNIETKKYFQALVRLEGFKDIVRMDRDNKLAWRTYFRINQ